MLINFRSIVHNRKLVKFKVFGELVMQSQSIYVRADSTKTTMPKFHHVAAEQDFSGMGPVAKLLHALIFAGPESRNMSKQIAITWQSKLHLL